MGVHPEVKRRVKHLRANARILGITTTQTSGFRSIQSQNRLYARFLAGRSRLPAAPPGLSTHNYGLAVDLVAVRGSQAILGRIAGLSGLVWAGAGDRVHFDPFGNARWKGILRSAGVRI